jgi:translation initiation factor IF-1
MVKNSTGGNKQKGFARKDSFKPSSAIRLSTNDHEIYATVTKIFGGKVCQVTTVNGIILKSIIRGKFSGKFKHSNLLKIGSRVLIGLHDFNSSDPSSDILEIYNDFDSLPQYDSITDSHDSIPFISIDHHSLTHTDSNHNLDSNLDSNLDLDLYIDLI